MNAHLDMFGIRPPAGPNYVNWPFEPPGEGQTISASRLTSSPTGGPERTATTTLTLASRSYLAPWLRAMQLSKGLGLQITEDFWWSGVPVDFFVGFGNVSGLSFASWWAHWGFAHYGWAMVTQVQVNYPKRRSKDCADKATLLIKSTKDSQRTLDEVEFVLTQVRHLQVGLLSSSPLLWPSFSCALSIAKINDYLSVYEAVGALPAAHTSKMLTVGTQLRLVPRAIVKSTDLPKERSEKQKKVSQLTSQYFAKGQAIVQNAARGVFPSTTPVGKGV
jgi:hypothetical protein